MTETFRPEPEAAEEHDVPHVDVDSGATTGQSDTPPSPPPPTGERTLNDDQLQRLFNNQLNGDTTAALFGQPPEGPKVVPVPAEGATETDKVKATDAPAKVGKYLDSPIPEGQLKDLERFGLSKEQIEKIREEINVHGQDPEKALVDLMKKVRVLAFGESHDETNPQRELGAKMIAKLKEAGATHLAIEAPPSVQAAIDEFMKTGKLDPEAFRGLFTSESFVKILEEARKAGLKIVCVDAEKKDRGERGGDDGGPSRDETMAAGISQILDADKNNKVVFWVGSGHLDAPKDPKSNYQDAAQILKKNYSVATVLDQGQQDIYSLSSIARDIKAPALVPTEKAKELGSITRNGPDYTPQSHYRDYDYVIIYPPPKR